MASETVDPIHWSHPQPSWAVPPERLVHSINRCSSASAGIRSCNLATFSMRGNHHAYAATQGIRLTKQCYTDINRLLSNNKGIELLQSRIFDFFPIYIHHSFGVFWILGYLERFRSRCTTAPWPNRGFEPQDELVGHRCVASYCGDIVGHLVLIRIEIFRA